MRKKRNKRKKITQAKKNKSKQAQVAQLTQAVLAQENATIESILFFTQRMQRKRLRCVRCVRLNGNRTWDSNRCWAMVHDDRDAMTMNARSN